MINKKVVQEFLAREMENHDWMKKLGPLELRAELAHEFKTIPNFSKLWEHQLVCFILCTTLKRFMLHIDMGGGKTLITLFSILDRKLRGLNPKAIIFVPYVTAVDTWIEECKKHTPDLKLVPLIGTTIQNLRLLEENDGDVFVVCYASMVAALSEKHPKKKGWTIDPKNTRRVFAAMDTFVADEIHKCSDIGTLTYRMCRAISEKCDYGIGLSGTPFGKDVADIWSQFYLIDFGETLGPTKGLFQQAFFTEKKNFFSGFNDFKFDKKKMPLLRKVIKHNSIHYDATEMHDLPEKRYIPIRLKLPTAAQSYVTLAAAQFIDAIKSQGSDRSRKAEASYLQLRQLASGFMTVDGENASKIKVSFDNNPKLDLLEEKIDGMPYGHKMVVFHHFVHTNNLISERLSKLKIKHARIWSGQKDVIGELKKFRDDPNCIVLVLNDQSGSSSLNLQHANYMFFLNSQTHLSTVNKGRSVSGGQDRNTPYTSLTPSWKGLLMNEFITQTSRAKNCLINS